MKVRIEPIKPDVGAIVHVDRAHLCDEGVAEQCLEALEDRGVLVFPQVNLTDKEQLAFTDTLGPRVDFTKNAPGGQGVAEQDVYKVTLDEDVNDAPEYVLGTYFWHIDGITMPIPLPKGTILSGRKLAQTGGKTEFANLYAAYEALPDDEKADIANLRAMHSLRASMRPLFDKEPTAEEARLINVATDTERPLVWTHKDGRKSLLVGVHADRILGLPLADGRAILARLQEWAGQPRFRYTHTWQQGDLVVWDNCGVMHRVTPYDAKSGRTMHRTTIAGSEATN